MRRTWKTLAVWAVLGGSLYAQNPIGQRIQPQLTNPRPFVLNPLLTGGPLSNYGNQSQFQAQAGDIQQLQQSFQNFQNFQNTGVPQTQETVAGNGLTTGHSVSFVNYSHYFPMMQRGGGIGGGSGIGARGVAQPSFQRGGIPGFPGAQNFQSSSSDFAFGTVNPQFFNNAPLPATPKTNP